MTTTECQIEPPTGVNLVQGGDFTDGLGSWAPFNAEFQIVSPAGDNMMEIARLTNSTYGGFYQYMPFSAGAGDALELTFDLGNNSDTNQVINMVVREGDWLDLHSCFMNLPAHSPVTTYTMRARTTMQWQNIVLQSWIWAGTYPEDPVYPFRFDNLSLQSLSSSPVTDTDCPVVSTASTGLSQNQAPTPVSESTEIVVATDQPTAEATAVAANQIIEAESNGVERSADWEIQTTGAAGGGAYVVSGAPDSSLTIYFSGTGVSVIYVAGPGFGDFNIQVDGAVVQTVSSAADAFAFGQQASVTGLSDGVHQLTILPQGTTGLDAFLIGQTPTTIPTATSTPTATPASTEAPVVEPTAPSTLAATEEPTASASPPETSFATEEPTPLPTATETLVTTEEPTLQPLPTTVLPIATLPPPMSTLEPGPLPTAPPTPSALILPAVAPMDASVWQVTGGWTLTNAASEDGTSFGWLAANTLDPALLTWTQPINLQSALHPTLSLRTAHQGDQASAAVQIAGNSGVWTQLIVILPGDGWQTITTDLSAYRGQIIQLRFAWLAARVTDNQSWQLAQIVVADAPLTAVPTVMLAETPSMSPTAEPIVAPTETPVPAETATPTSQPTATPTPTDTPAPSGLPNTPEVTPEAP